MVELIERDQDDFLQCSAVCCCLSICWCQCWAAGRPAEAGWRQVGGKLSLWMRSCSQHYSTINSESWGQCSHLTLLLQINPLPLLLVSTDCLIVKVRFTIMGLQSIIRSGVLITIITKQLCLCKCYCGFKQTKHYGNLKHMFNCL